MDKLRAMTVFVSIAEQGSLTAAAQALGTSLPSVVRTLAALEEWLRVRLFNRTTRRIVLTREGELYLERCRKILAEIAETEQMLVAEQAEPAGAIRVTAPVRFGEMHVAPVITRFLKQYPRVEVQLLLLDRIVDLVDEGIDVAVRIAQLGDSSLVARPIGQIRQVVCASPQLLAQVSEPRHPNELSTLPCVRYTGISPGSAWQFVVCGEPLAVRVAGAFACNQIAAAVDACVAGLGFGRFLSYQVWPWIRSNELVPVLSQFEPAPFPLSLVYPHARRQSSRVRLMVDCLASQIGSTLT